MKTFGLSDFANIDDEIPYPSYVGVSIVLARETGVDVARGKM